MRESASKQQRKPQTRRLRPGQVLVRQPWRHLHKPSHHFMVPASRAPPGLQSVLVRNRHVEHRLHYRRDPGQPADVPRARRAENAAKDLLSVWDLQRGDLAPGLQPALLRKMGSSGEDRKDSQWEVQRPVSLPELRRAGHRPDRQTSGV